MKVLYRVVLFLTMIGSLNWGLVGLFDFNLVHFLTTAKPELEQIAYLIIGACGLYGLYMLLWGKLN